MNTANGDRKLLQHSNGEKDLGVLVTSSLKPTEHCLKAANRGMSALRLLRTSFNQLNETNFRILYTMYVRPHLDYCLQAVGPYMCQDLTALEKVQRRATKLVSSVRNMPYQERLRILKIPSIKDRLLRGDMIMTYKILTKKVDMDPNQLFELSEDVRTRGHHLKLNKRRSRTVQRSKFFSNRVVSPWNQLPEDVVSAGSTNSASKPFRPTLDHK